MALQKRIQLFDNMRREIVFAELISPSKIVVKNTERRWRFYREQKRLMQMAGAITTAGLPTILESAVWDWEYKFATYDNGSVELAALDINGSIEGLMMLARQTQRSWLPHPRGTCVQYVEFLEAAPWNQAAYMGNDVKYKGVGLGLLRCATWRSMDTGCEGAVGLHSLPEAEGFYRHLGFQDLGFDAEEGYRYFELSSDDAANFERNLAAHDNKS